MVPIVASAPGGRCAACCCTRLVLGPAQPDPWDGAKHAWLAGQLAFDLIITMDDATSELYSAFLVDQEGTMSSFCGLVEVVEQHGLFIELYTDRGSHYFHTPEAGGKVSKTQLTQVGRALKQLGIGHIPASASALGRRS